MVVYLLWVFMLFLAADSLQLKAVFEKNSNPAIDLGSLPA
jgi:hypothetical protein